MAVGHHTVQLEETGGVTRKAVWWMVWDFNLQTPRLISPELQQQFSLAMVEFNENEDRYKR